MSRTFILTHLLSGMYLDDDLNDDFPYITRDFWPCAKWDAPPSMCSQKTLENTFMK